RPLRARVPPLCRLTSPSLLSFCCYGHHRHLHSFPTRRSSDLELFSRNVVSLIILPNKHVAPDKHPRNRYLFHRAGGRSIGDSPADRKSTRLNSSHVSISYAVFCLKKKKNSALYQH